MQQKTDPPVDLKQIVLMLLDSSRKLLAVDRHDPMNNPPRTEEIAAINELRKSVRHAERVEYLLTEKTASDTVDAMQERSGLDRLFCSTCGRDIVATKDDIIPCCVDCALI